MFTALSNLDSEAVFLLGLSNSLTVCVCSSWFCLILFLRALQNSSSSACFQLSPLSIWFGISSWGGGTVNIIVWWSNRLPILVAMNKSKFSLHFWQSPWWK